MVSPYRVNFTLPTKSRATGERTSARQSAKRAGEERDQRPVRNKRKVVIDTPSPPPPGWKKKKVNPVPKKNRRPRPPIDSDTDFVESMTPVPQQKDATAAVQPSQSSISVDTTKLQSARPPVGPKEHPRVSIDPTNDLEWAVQDVPLHLRLWVKKAHLKAPVFGEFHRVDVKGSNVYASIERLPELYQMIQLQLDTKGWVIAPDRLAMDLYYRPAPGAGRKDQKGVPMKSLVDFRIALNLYSRQDWKDSSNNLKGYRLDVLVNYSEKGKKKKSLTSSAPSGEGELRPRGRPAKATVDDKECIFKLLFLGPIVKRTQKQLQWYEPEEDMTVHKMRTFNQGSLSDRVQFGQLYDQIYQVCRDLPAYNEGDKCLTTSKSKLFANLDKRRKGLEVIVADSDVMWNCFQKIAASSSDKKTIELQVGMGKNATITEDKGDDPSMEYETVILSQREPGEWNSPEKVATLTTKESRKSSTNLFKQVNEFVTKCLTHPECDLYHSMSIEAERVFISTLANDSLASKTEGAYVWDIFGFEVGNPQSFPSLDDLPFLGETWAVKQNKGLLPTKGCFPRDATGTILKTPNSNSTKGEGGNELGIFKLASAIDNLNNPMATRTSVRLDVKRVPFEAGEDTVGYGIRHIAQDLDMSVFDAVKEACKSNVGVRILKKTEAVRKGLELKTLQVLFQLGDKEEDQLKHTVGYWKGVSLRNAVSIVLKEEESKLPILVTYEAVYTVASDEEDSV